MNLRRHLSADNISTALFCTGLALSIASLAFDHMIAPNLVVAGGMLFILAFFVWLVAERK